MSHSIGCYLDDYSISHVTTELSAGETLLYISDILSYQLRNDPNL